MEWGSTSYYVKVQKTASSSYRLAVLFKFDAKTWGLYHLRKDLKLKRLRDLKDEIIEERDPSIVQVDQEDLVENEEIDLSSFNMSPPSLLLNSSPLKEDFNTDPEHYINKKYLSALYSNDDLMFFAKSTFARLKLLTDQVSASLEKTLSSPLLDIDLFNAKYDIPIDTFFEINSESLESDFKSKFIANNRGEPKTQIKRKLKIREIKLQMILLMELVILRQNTDSKSTTSITPTKKPSLVRRKTKKKVLIPTFSGTLADPSLIADPIAPKELTLDLCQSGVRKYLDMLLVVTSIEEGIEDTKSKPDIIDFLSNIIIPFYYKKLTPLCKELIKTVKGVSMKRKPKTLTKSQLSLEPGIKLTRNKKPTTTLQRNKSSLDEFFVPKPALKRSASTISSSTKMLEKRTIDFTSSTNLKSTSIKMETAEVLRHDTETQKGIFGTKMSSRSIIDTAKAESFFEIGETPVKKQKTTHIVDVDQNSKVNRNLFQVIATPDNHKIDEAIGSEELFVNSSPLSFKRTRVPQHISSSPVKNSDDEDESSKIQSSAIRRKNQFISRMMKHSPRPGDPVMIPRSPLDERNPENSYNHHSP